MLKYAMDFNAKIYELNLSNKHVSRGRKKVVTK